MEEINELLYYFAEKYGYDPLDHKINLLTGIVVPRKQGTAVNPGVMGVHPQPDGAPPRGAGRVPAAGAEQPAPDRKRVEVEDTVEGLRTYRIYAYSQQESAAGLAPVEPGDPLRELDEWITCNGLSYLEARRLIASLELNRRMGELYPHLDRGGEGLLSEFEEWIRLRQLSYFRVRTMIAELGQGEERGRAEAVAA